MKLREIDKTRYRKHSRQLFFAIVIALVIIALGSSTLMIHWFGTPGETHFSFNLAGVVLAVIVITYLVYRLRQHPFMEEVVYVWNLKKQLNAIYRKQRHVEPLIEDNNVDAMIVMSYFYQGSKQLYELDDNTITLDDLAIKALHLTNKIEENGLEISADDYTPGLLERF